MARPKPQPCPFCGGVVDKQWHLVRGPEPSADVRVWCIECGAEGPNGVSIDEAVRLWNYRKAEDR